MSNRIEVLTRCFIGYNKKQVEEYIEEINIIHQKTVNFLKDNIENHRQEKERLLSELSGIKSFNQGGEKSKELMELAIKRAAKTIVLIKKMTEEDVRKVIENTNNKIVAHKNHVRNLERDLEDERMEIDQLLNKVQLPFQNIKQPALQEAALTEKTFLEKTIKNMTNPRLDNVVKLSEMILSRNASSTLSTDHDIEEHNFTETRSNKDFEREIEKIREKHLVGKTAGADLLDQKGNLIIAKNIVISPEIIKEAEKEGKLAELIVNMS